MQSPIQTLIWTGGEGRGLRDTHHGGAAEGGRMRGPRKEGRAAQQDNELDDKNHMNLDCFEWFKKI